VKNLSLHATSFLVSVCIPTFNAERWILDCLNSALAQSYQPLEILVVDDASTDNTVDLLRSIKDERIRLIVNETNLGLTGNWNKCVELAQGKFIKFLFQDDLLYPLCIEKMMRLFLAEENLGLVFSPRDIILDADKDDPTTQEWIEGCTTLHTRFTPLSEINSGRQLFLEYLAKEFRGNWIGEPSSVMIRKECFDHLGLFNVAMYQNCDVEMWLRIIFFYDAGFVQEKLSAFRFHRNSASHANIKSQRHRLDHVRLLEGLLAYDEIRSTYPELRKMRRWEVVRNIVRLIVPLPVRLKIFHHFHRV
jgi:glycosyltransferase involved in cell wall biosynthesis